ncbi:MAG: hypothetical protein EP343_26085 [Deltaproteobacteria bacterium]|nr:MAG: hypothetical protein EP343_26085 [Deltaproteobacteria bacterium]
MNQPEQPQPLSRQPSLLQYIALLLVLLSAVAWGVLWLPLGTPPPQEQPKKPHEHRPPFPSSRVLKIAGSGSNLPLTRLLVQAYLKHSKKPPSSIRLYDSIGSTGGIHAVREKAVHVGLLSRPLKKREQSPQLRLFPYAKVAVVLAAHPTVPITAVNKKHLFDLYAGKQRHWPNGQRVVVLQRERGDSSHRAVERAFPRFAEINSQAYKARRWRVLYSDQQMQRALLETRGAIGLLDYGLIRSQKLPLRILPLHGHNPSLQALEQGSYPFAKQLLFVTLGAPHQQALDFLRFVFAPSTQVLIRRYGYLPLQPGKTP